MTLEFLAISSGIPPDVVLSSTARYRHWSGHWFSYVNISNFVEITDHQIMATLMNCIVDQSSAYEMYGLKWLINS